ncbi:MAG: hypothetical protein ACLVJO_05630 [[Clostridium] scindens]
MIRNGIKNSIEWEKEGYEFVGRPAMGNWLINDRQRAAGYSDNRYKNAVYGRLN